MIVQKEILCRIVIFTIILMFEIIPAYSEIIPLMGYDNNFENSLRYPADGHESMYRIHNIDASEAGSKNGIIFGGEGDSNVRIHVGDPFFSLAGVYPGPRCIEHAPSGESSAGEGLIIRFKYPVEKCGVALGTISFSDHRLEGIDSASLRAYSSDGQFVGSVEMTVTSNPPNFDGFSIFGFETTSGADVTTVILDYGNSEKPERIETIYYEYKAPRPFKVVFPQFAHGTVSDASINSDLVLFWDRSATIKTFSTSGEYLPMPILAEGANFILPIEEITGVPKGTPRQFYFKSSTIPGIDDLTVGYVVGESDYPIDGQVVYRTTDAQGKVYEADIRGCVPETYLQIPFELNQAENLNAALAIVNPSDTEARIEIHVNDADQSYTEFWDPPTFTLQPGEQRALFMWELWNEMPAADGNYTLQLRSAVPFAAAAFYTRDWIVVGNLPVWSYKEGQAR